MLKKMRPIGNRVLVEIKKEQKQTASGLYIPDAVESDNSQLGTVLAVGPGIRDTTGNAIPMQVQAGDMIYFGKYSGTEVENDVLILREDEILGILDK